MRLSFGPFSSASSTIGAALAARPSLGAVPAPPRPGSPATPPAAVPSAWCGRGPVVFIGGLLTTEPVLQPMRLWPEQLGYTVLVHAVDAGLGCAARSVEAVRRRLDEAEALDEHGDGVRVVGYSRGGQFARVAAAVRPVRAWSHPAALAAHVEAALSRM